VTPDELVRLLADTNRLRVFSALVLGARTRAELVRDTGLDDQAVEDALRRLASGGLVTLHTDQVRPRQQVFTELTRATATTKPTEDYGYTDQKVESVLRSFVHGGRLVTLPAQQSRRRIVLEHVVRSFEPGIRYPEREVDAVLRAWCAGGNVDHITLRRSLIDHGLLTREDSLYWRSGGWLDVLDG